MPKNRELRPLLTLAACLLLLTAGPLSFAASPSLSITEVQSGQVKITWTDPSATFVIDQSDALGSGASWLSSAVPSVNGDLRTVTVTPDAHTRFFRLRQAAQPVTGIDSISPAEGEIGVAVTRETIFRFDGPLASDVTFAASSLFAEFGGRRLLSRNELSGDRKTATLFYLENLPASARVHVTLDGTNLRDATGTPLDADNDGLPGGIGVIEFETAGTSALPGTAVAGYVYASEKNADGSNKPLSNVTVTVDGAEETLRTTTDATGAFTLEPAPVGRFFVHVDGRTAVGSHWPGGAYYPFVGKAWNAIAGLTNNLAGGSGEIFLPLIQNDALQSVSSTAETKITFTPGVLASNPSLAGVEINVPPNALFSDNGTRGGKVGMAPVPADRLPEPLPPGLNLPLVITIQTDGGSNFDRPVPVKFPNLPDPVTGETLPPGAKTVLWSFNHDTGRWEPQGTATITADGLFAVTDPGVGIRQPGWHGTSPSTAGNGPQGCTDCDGPKCGAYPPRCCQGWNALKEPCRQKQEQALTAIQDLALDDFLYLIGGPGGCKFGSTLSVGRAARDCAAVGQFTSDCLDTIEDGAIGNAIGCLPGVGGGLGLAWGAKNVIKGSIDYKACLDTQIATCIGAPNHVSAFVDAPVTHDPRLERALAALDLQVKVSAACSNSLTKMLGSSRWAYADSPDALNIYRNFMGAIVSGISTNGPGGALLTTDERNAILLLPRPNGATAAQATQLMDRMEAIASGKIANDSALRNDLVAAFDILVKIIEEIQNRGWTDFLDGFWIAMMEFSSMSTPSDSSSSTVGQNAQPALHAQAVSSDNSFPVGPLYYKLTDLRSGFEQRGRLSSSGRFENIFLRPDSYYAVSYLDPKTLLYGTTVFHSGPAGQTTSIPSAPILTSPTSSPAGPPPDSDGDGLPDQAEIILGTNPVKADSDADGINDKQELFLDSDPLDGVGLPLGIVSAAPTPGTASDVVAQNGFALVASAGGLIVFDVSAPRKPVRAALVPGVARAVTMRSSAALVAFADSVQLLEVSAPTAPKVVWNHKINGPQAVAIGSTSAFIGSPSEFVRLDPATGAQLESFPVPGESLLVRGDLIYVLGNGQLTVWREGEFLQLLGTFAAPGAGGAGGRPRRLSIGGNLLYAQHNFGFNVFDLADPTTPTLLNDTRKTEAGWRHIVPTGTGLALAAVGAASTDDGPHDVSLYRFIPNGTDVDFVTTFVTPGYAEAVAISGGIGFVADGIAGLTVVNFLDPDLKGIAPTIVAEVDSVGNPPKVEGSSLVRITARANDDFAVKRVDFLIDGQALAQDDSFPFEFFYRVPPFSSTTPQIKVRLRAEDMSGNVGVSPEIVLNVVLDAAPPRIASLEPPRNSLIVPASISDVAVAFQESIVTPVNASTLTLLASGPDQEFGTADDSSIPGSVRYDAPAKAVIFTAQTPLVSNRYRASLAAGLADAAGNARPLRLSWDFATGPEPRMIIPLPPENFVNVGGTLERLTFTFNQPLPKASAATYVWKVSRRAEDGHFEEISPIRTELSTDSRTFYLRAQGPFPPGLYHVTGEGPNIQATFWDFTFRDVPNEWIPDSEHGSAMWKYFPGPGFNDRLIIDAPGTLLTLQARDLEAVLARSDLRLLNQTVDIDEPLQTFGKLVVGGTVFPSGQSEVHGPLSFVGDLEIRAHTMNLYGGGLVEGLMRFPDPNGALVNQPGSVLTLSSGVSVQDLGTGPTNAGRLVNLGTIRNVGEPTETTYLEGVRVRNSGRLEIVDGKLAVRDIENEGTIDISANAKLLLVQRARDGISSRITGAGSVEFGANNYKGARGTYPCNVEVKGDYDAAGSFTLVAGDVVMWRPLVRSNQVVEVQNFGTLRLLAPAQLDSVKLNPGTISLNSDSEIKTFETVQPSSIIEASTVARVTGDAKIRGLEVGGIGVVEFAGTTLVTNGTQAIGIGIRDATLRNVGTWSHASAGAVGSTFNVLLKNGQPGLGAFENIGTFRQTVARPLTFRVPFRNAGRAEFAAVLVAFDSQATPSNDRLGSYNPLSGAELVLNGTDLQNQNTGTLDLKVGTVRGTGSITVTSDTGASKVINRAVLQPGNPTGTLSIRAIGGFEQAATGELTVSINASGNSLLGVDSGSAQLDGTLRVQLADGLSPALGTIFTIINCPSRTGQFSNLILPSPGDGKRFEVIYEVRAVKVRVVAP